MHLCPLGEQVFDIAKAQREPGKEPDSVADDLRRKAMAFERERLNSFRLPTQAHQNHRSSRHDAAIGPFVSCDPAKTRKRDWARRHTSGFVRSPVEALGRPRHPRSFPEGP